MAEIMPQGMSCFSRILVLTLLNGRREKPYRRPGPAGSGQRGSALCPGQRQRWEAVFRRERRPVSLDRFSTQAQSRLYLAMQGENAVGMLFSPCDPNVLRNGGICLKECFL